MSETPSTVCHECNNGEPMPRCTPDSKYCVGGKRKNFFIYEIGKNLIGSHISRDKEEKWCLMQMKFGEKIIYEF